MLIADATCMYDHVSVWQVVDLIRAANILGKKVLNLTVRHRQYRGPA